MDNYYAAAAGASAASTLISLIVAVITLVAMWKVFEKAGKAGWKCIIPIYNAYCMFDIAWGKGWFFLLMCIPFVNIAVGIILALKMAKAFGKGTGFGIGLLLIAPVFYMILGFGDAQYVGPQN